MDWQTGLRVLEDTLLSVAGRSPHCAVAAASALSQYRPHRLRSRPSISVYKNTPKRPPPEGPFPRFAIVLLLHFVCYAIDR